MEAEILEEMSMVVGMVFNELMLYYFGEDWKKIILTMGEQDGEQDESQ